MCLLFVALLLFGSVSTKSSRLTADPQERAFPAAADSKVPWSDDETLHLLDIWGKDSVQRALKGCLKNRHIFTQIAQKMAERGHMRTVEQCQTRIKRLKKCFRRSNRYRFSFTRGTVKRISVTSIKKCHLFFSDLLLGGTRGKIINFIQSWSRFSAPRLLPR